MITVKLQMEACSFQWRPPPPPCHIPQFLILYQGWWWAESPRVWTLPLIPTHFWGERGVEFWGGKSTTAYPHYSAVIVVKFYIIMVLLVFFTILGLKNCSSSVCITSFALFMKPFITCPNVLFYKKKSRKFPGKEHAPFTEITLVWRETPLPSLVSRSGRPALKLCRCPWVQLVTGTWLLLVLVALTLGLYPLFGAQRQFKVLWYADN